MSLLACGMLPHRSMPYLAICDLNSFEVCLCLSVGRLSLLLDLSLCRAFNFAALICGVYVGKVQPNYSRIQVIPTVGSDIGVCMGPNGLM